MPRTSTLALASPSDRLTMRADRHFTAAKLLVEDLLAGTRITRTALHDCMASVDIEIIHIVTGLLLPVWSSLPDDDVSVWRLSTPDGTDMLDRIVPPRGLARLMRTFGLEDTVRLSPSELVRGASQGQGVSVPGRPGTSLVEVRVNGNRRLELRGFPASRMAWLKSLGCFTEIIAFRTRLFLPGDRAADILATIQEAN